MAGFDTIPKSAVIQPTPFKVDVPDEKIADFKQLLKLSPVGPTTFENQQQDRRFGITQTWLKDAKEHWLGKFDWREHEKHINSFPNFKTTITDDDGTKFSIHFAGLFSQKPDAVPVALFHGWPGSFLEFLPMLGIMREKYTSENLPYHLICPSLVGYAFSSGLPVDKNFTIADTARIMDKLMSSLGFGSGYVAQGGDLGAGVTRILALTADSCKAAHVNLLFADLSQPLPEGSVNAEEAAAMKRSEGWLQYGAGYATEHGTRPATIGLVLSSSPLSLLSWIGEKFLEWSDEDPSLDTILESVSLYWFTETFPRSIYPYRERWGKPESNSQEPPKHLAETTISKPFGFSWFPYELRPTPRVLAEKAGNLVWHRQHTKGGHFAALEQAKEFAQDVEDFVAKAWPMRS